MPQRAIKIAILLAPWIAGIVLLWRSPIYLAIFLGVSALFAWMQRGRALPPPPGNRLRSRREAREEEARERMERDEAERARAERRAAALRSEGGRSADDSGSGPGS